MTEEIHALEQQLSQKQQELVDLNHNSSYKKQRRRLKEELQALQINYNRGKNYTSRNM